MTGWYSVNNSQGHVLLVEIHPLIQEAIRLLLQELQHHTAIVHDARHWKVQIHAIPVQPELIIAPLVLENGTSGEHLVDKLRAHFHCDIPAILMAGDDELDAVKALPGNIVVLSGTLVPKQLRRVIGELLNGYLVD